MEGEATAPVKLLLEWRRLRSVPGECSVVEEYDVRPWARARVLDCGGRRLYDLELVEPSDVEARLLERLVTAAQRRSAEWLEARLERLVSRGRVSSAVAEWLKVELRGLGVLDIILSDGFVEDVQVRAPEYPLRIVHSKYGYLLTTFKLPAWYIEWLASKLQRAAGVTVTLRRPFASFQLGRLRVTLTIRSDVSPETTITIRRQVAPWNLGLYVRLGVLPVEAASLLWLAVLARVPILVVGEMASGKTSMINALLSVVPEEYTVVLIEDQPELTPPWPAIRLLTRDSPDPEARVTAFDLLVHSLRESADIVTLGEVRGEEASAWGQAILLGHGGLTSFHGSDARRALYRLMMPPLNVPPVCVDQLGAVVLMRRLARGDSIVRVAEVYSVEGVEDGEPKVKPLTTYADGRHVTSDLLSSRLASMVASRLGVSLDEFTTLHEAYTSALARAASESSLGEEPREFNVRLYSRLREVSWEAYLVARR